MKMTLVFIPLERKRNSRVKSSFLTGFTLLELVLSVAISGIVLLVIYSSFSLGLRVWERVGNRIGPDAQRILNQLSTDLRSTYLPAEEGANLGFTGSATSIKFITVACLRHNLSALGEYDLREVRYYLELGPHKNLYCLIRGIDFTLGENIFKTNQLTDLSKLVKSLRFTYYDGQTWQKAWNSTEQLPQAVCISLELKPEYQGSSSEIFSTIVGIPYR